MALVLTTARAFATCERAKKMLIEAGHEVKIITPSNPLKSDELLPLVKGVDAIIAGLDQFSSDVIEAAAPSLKIIARNGVGYDKIDLDSANKHNVYVVITPGANSISVCELAFSLMSCLARKINLMDGNIKKYSWQRVLGSELYGKTIGIMGTGSIGTNLAKRCIAFGMKVIAYDMHPNQELIEYYGVKYTTNLEEIYKSSDYISLHIPSTATTYKMINQDAIEKMKQGVILINTARGDLIDEDALYQGLLNEKIGGAGLDTFNEEPFKDERFFKLDNVILTPHAGAFTQEATERMLVADVNEVIKVLSGNIPENIVNTIISKDKVPRI